LIFLSVELSLFLFLLFVEAGLLNCINCNPVPRGTTNHPDEASEKFASLQTDSGLQLDLAIRVKRCLSEDAAPRIFQSGQRCVETSGDVTEKGLRLPREFVEHYPQ
jgi:hypothetical protein